MYSILDKAWILNELNSGGEVWCVDMQTERVMRCADMSIGTINSFAAKQEAFFVKKVEENE